MKKWKCDSCNKEIEVTDDYDPEYCCTPSIESPCGCMGGPTNPIFCDECEEKIFGKKNNFIISNGELIIATNFKAEDLINFSLTPCNNYFDDKEGDNNDKKM